MAREHATTNTLETDAAAPEPGPVAHPLADPSCTCEGLGCLACCGEALP